MKIYQDCIPGRVLLPYNRCSVKLIKPSKIGVPEIGDYEGAFRNEIVSVDIVLCGSMEYG